MSWPMAPLDLATHLRQRETWINASGESIPVKDIDSGYAKNILRMLQGNAKAWKEAVENIYVYAPAPSGEAASLAFDNEFDAILRATPSEWMRAQPLYRAIQYRATKVQR